MTLIYEAVIFFTILTLSVCGTFFPTSKVIYVPEGGEYRFGFIKDAKDYRCMYSSDKGTRRTFIVNRSADITDEEIEIPSNDVHNFIWAFTKKGLCEFHIRDATRDGPNSITVSTYGWFGLTRSATVKIIYIDKVPIASTAITAYQGSSFVQYLRPENAVYLQCILQLGYRQKHIFHPVVDNANYTSSDDNEEIEIEEEDETFKKVLPLGNNLCGFRMDNVTWQDISRMNYTLIGTFNNENFFGNSFSLNVVNRKSTYSETHEIVLGSNFTINCPLVTHHHSFMHNLCEIYNPHGQLIERSCRYHIPVVTLNHIGIWTCAEIEDMDFSPVRHFIELIKFDKRKVSGWIEDQATHAIIGCKIDDFMGIEPIDRCSMTLPTNEEITVIETAISKRYSAYDSDFSRGICSLKIKKPLESKEEGLWKCQIYDNGEHLSTLLTLANKTIDKPENNSVLNIRESDPFTIDCKASKSYDFCYIRSPNGTTFLNREDFWPGSGQCTLSIKNASLIDDGQWTCFFGHFGQADKQFDIQVKIKKLLTYTDYVENDEGTPLKLMCNSDGLPLQYCIFVSPNDTVFYMTNANSSSDLVQYIGNGLEYGDCGIEIIRSVSTDDGEWTCQTKIGFTNEIFRKINVSIFGNSEWSLNYRNAMIIGVVVLIIVAVFSVAIYRKCRENDTSRMVNEAINYSYRNSVQINREEPVYQDVISIK